MFVVNYKMQLKLLLLQHENVVVFKFLITSFHKFILMMTNMQWSQVQ